MKTVKLKCITIIAEDTLQSSLTNELSVLGVKGYTIEKATGKGEAMERMSEWEGENIRLEVLVGEAMAEKIVEKLSQDYFNRYSLIAYLTDAEVIRGEKFL
ncbi:MAG: hypothetical protein SFU91_07700 [Chloroherpetonaceae bacterium]|nr:hypothetical protein [Chloroherpetonaceae bacterium]